MEKVLKNLEDEYKWARETVDKLRRRDFDAIDVDELIDEIEAIATGMERELVYDLEKMMKAILQLEYTNAPKRDAEVQLGRAQSQLQLLLGGDASLIDAVTEDLIDEAYQCARQDVSEDYGVTLPERCPFSRQTLLEHPLDELHGP